MRERLKKIRPGHQLLIVVLVLAAVAGVRLFHSYRALPIKGYYDQEKQQVVLYPGLLYTLEGYFTEVIYGEDFLSSSSEPGDKELRFDLALGEKGSDTEIWVTVRDSLTGRTQRHQVDVHRQWARSYESCQFYVSGAYCGSANGFSFYIDL